MGLGGGGELRRRRNGEGSQRTFSILAGLTLIFPITSTTIWYQMNNSAFLHTCCPTSMPTSSSPSSALQMCVTQVIETQKDTGLWRSVISAHTGSSSFGSHQAIMVFHIMFHPRTLTIDVRDWTLDFLHAWLVLYQISYDPFCPNQISHSYLRG